MYGVESKHLLYFLFDAIFEYGSRLLKNAFFLLTNYAVLLFNGIRLRAYPHSQKVSKKKKEKKARKLYHYAKFDSFKRTNSFASTNVTIHTKNDANEIWDIFNSYISYLVSKVKCFYDF